MNTFSQLTRLIHIHYILAKHGLDELLFATKWFASLRFLVYVNPWYWRNRHLDPALRLRLAFEELGPIFIKFGQMLSARPDLLPEPWPLQRSKYIGISRSREHQTICAGSH